MFSYILKRVLAMIPTLIGISFLTFFIILLAPGDPVATQFGAEGGPGAASGGANNSPEKQADTIKAKKKLLGMLQEQYAVLTWDAAAAADARNREIEDKYRVSHPLVEGDALGEFQGWARDLAQTADGSALFVATRKGYVFVLEPASGTTRAIFGNHESDVWAVALSPDGKSYASGDADGTVVVAATGNGNETARVGPFDRPITDLVYLPDGSGFLSACQDGSIRLHDPSDATVRQVYDGHIGYVTALAISASGDRFWSGGYDRKLREWTTEGGAMRVLDGRGQPINSLALAPDGSFIVTGADDRVVRVYATTESEEPLLAELKGHFAAVTSVAVHPDGRTIFSGSSDEEIRVWDRVEKRITGRSPRKTGGAVHAMLSSPDGATLYSVGESWRKTPVHQQYLHWAGNLAVGDFGRSFIDKRPVIDKMAEALPITLYLNLIAFTLIYLVGIPIGVMSAVKRGTPFDTGASVVVFMLWSIPSFWLATMLIMTFSSKRALDWLPSVGLHGNNHEQLSYLEWLGDWGAHLVLPMIVLVYNGFAGLSQFARTSMLETIAQDFVRTARAKGLSERVVIFKHAFRNSLIAIITLFGSFLPAMIGGSVIIEYIFNIQGMGLLGYEAILQRDYPVIMAVVTFGAILTLLGILVSDLLYSVVDPRITHK